MYWKHLKSLSMYSSNVCRLPRELGQCHDLENLDMYTSYGPHDLPAEIVFGCRKLRDSQFSTRALFRNYKENSLWNPPLLPVDGPNMQKGGMGFAVGPRYISGLIEKAVSVTTPFIVLNTILSFVPWNYCSVCRRLFQHRMGSYQWSVRQVGTDGQCLLSSCCSKKCRKHPLLGDIVSTPESTKKGKEPADWTVAYYGHSHRKFKNKFPRFFTAGEGKPVW